MIAALAHPPPFTDEECGAFDGQLVIEHARSLAGLERFTALTDLSLIKCSIDDLSTVAELRNLDWLRAIACPISDLSPLAEIELWGLDVSFCDVEDPRSAIGPAMDELRLIGNPLSVEAYEDLVARVDTPDLASRPVATLPSREDLALTHALRAMGMRAGVAELDRDDVAVVDLGSSPGGWRSSRAELHAHIADRTVTDHLARLQRRSLDGLTPPFEIVNSLSLFRSHVESTIEAFLSRFSRDRFLRDRPGSGPPGFPAWLRRCREQLVGLAVPGARASRTEVIFGPADRKATDSLCLDGLWFLPTSPDELSYPGYVPIAQSANTSWLAVSATDSDDPAIYVIEPDAGRAEVRFASYGEMLRHVMAARNADRPADVAGFEKTPLSEGVGEQLARLGIELVTPAADSPRDVRTPSGRYALPYSIRQLLYGTQCDSGLALRGPIGRMLALRFRLTPDAATCGSSPFVSIGCDGDQVIYIPLDTEQPEDPPLYWRNDGGDGDPIDFQISLYWALRSLVIAPPSAEPVALPDNLRETIETLGGAIEPRYRDLGLDGAPPVLRAFVEDVAWPDNRPTFTGEYGAWKVWLVRLGVYCRHGDCITFAHADGGNYRMFLELRDPNPDNPMVFMADTHELPFDGQIRLAPLRAFLAGLHREARTTG